MEIKNKTKKPISIPLPGGKKLFLGPGKSGQIIPKAVESPAVIKLIEAGDVEVTDKGVKHTEGGGSGGGGASGTSYHPGSGAKRQSGDR